MRSAAATAARRAVHGFTLVEVLISLIVLSIGLLGIAALYLETLRANRTALSRTQAVTLAADLADRIRANRDPPGAYACAAPCNPAGAGNPIAITDLTMWVALVQTQLPGGAGSVTYVVDGKVNTPAAYTIAVSFAEPSETNVRGRVVKSVGRPADIYSLGAVFYYLISGAYANPKNLYDAFRKFVEYEKRDENNSIAAYVEHEYRTIQNMRAPKAEGQGAPELAPEDRFFSYKHYLDGNGELIDPAIMMIIAKAMIRNKPDSYCLSYDLRTTGISAMVHDLLALYVHYGQDPSARIAFGNEGYVPPKKSGVRRAFDKLFRK